MSKVGLAERISLFLQPTFVAIILYALVSFTYLRGKSAWFFFLLSVLFVTLFPMLLVIWLVRRGKVSDPDLPDRRERFIPYLAICGLYGVLFLLLSFFSAPLPLLAVTLCYLGVTLAGAFISLFWKISLHLAGVAGPVTAMVMLVHPWWSVLYLFLMPLGWARWYLRKHTLSQIIAGGLLSMGITWGIIAGIL